MAPSRFICYTNLNDQFTELQYCRRQLTPISALLPPEGMELPTVSWSSKQLRCIIQERVSAEPSCRKLWHAFKISTKIHIRHDRLLSCRSPFPSVRGVPILADDDIHQMFTVST